MKSSILQLGDYFDHESFKEEVFASLTDISKQVPMGSNLLVATYIEPAKTKGGLIMPESSRAEGRFQGKVSLVLAIGPTAFKYDGPTAYAYEGPKPEVGDWIVHFPSNSREFFLYNYSCRLVDSDLVEMITHDPSAIW